MDFSWGDMLGDTLQVLNNDKLDDISLTAALAEAKYIGLYFSAHWCPPCRAFTPKLVTTYRELHDSKKGFQVVFVSSDHSHEAMLGYMQAAEMPWPAIPHGDIRAAKLKKKFQIWSIPSLVILNSRGELVTKDGRAAVAQTGAKAIENCFAGSTIHGGLPSPFAIPALCFALVVIYLLWSSMFS